jgi:hypothetical protein
MIGGLAARRARHPWVRDAAWREDDQHAYAGRGAQVMAAYLALGLLRLSGIAQVKRTLECIAGDRTRILPILATAIRT